MLEWKFMENSKTLCAKSDKAPFGYFRIHYDDVMYWPSWSADCSQDLDQLKHEAQTIHDS